MAIDWAARRKAANKKTVEPKYDAKTSYSWKSQLRPIAELEQEIQQKNYERITSSEDFGVMPSASVPGSIAQKGANKFVQEVRNRNLEYDKYKAEQDRITQEDATRKPAPWFNLKTVGTSLATGMGDVNTGVMGTLGFLTYPTRYLTSNINKLIWGSDLSKYDKTGTLTYDMIGKILGDSIKTQEKYKETAYTFGDYEHQSELTKIAADVARSLPAQASLALPGGMVAYGSISVGNSLNQYVKGEQPWYKEYGMALGSAGFDIATEGMFPVFGNLYKGFTKATVKSAARQGAKKFLPTMFDYVKVLGSSMAQEGTEEAVSYVGTSMLDWALMKEFKGESDFDLGQMGRSALIGSFSAMMLSVMPMVEVGRETASKKEWNRITAELMAKNPKDVTNADVEKAIAITAKYMAENGITPNNVADVTAKADENRKAKVNRIISSYRPMVGTLPNSTTNTNVGTVATDVAPVSETQANANINEWATIQGDNATVGANAPVIQTEQVTQQPQQNIVQNVNMQESVPVVESKQQEGKRMTIGSYDLKKGDVFESVADVANGKKYVFVGRGIGYGKILWQTADTIEIDTEKGRMSRPKTDEDISYLTEREYSERINNEVDSLNEKIKSIRKQASDYNKSTGGRATKGKAQATNMGVERGMGYHHSALMDEVKSLSQRRDELLKRIPPPSDIKPVVSPKPVAEKATTEPTPVVSTPKAESLPSKIDRLTNEIVNAKQAITDYVKNTIPSIEDRVQSLMEDEASFTREYAKKDDTFEVTFTFEEDMGDSATFNGETEDGEVYKDGLMEFTKKKLAKLLVEGDIRIDNEPNEFKYVTEDGDGSFDEAQLNAMNGTVSQLTSELNATKKQVKKNEDDNVVKSKEIAQTVKFEVGQMFFVYKVTRTYSGEQRELENVYVVSSIDADGRLHFEDSEGPGSSDSNVRNAMQRGRWVLENAESYANKTVAQEAEPTSTYISAEQAKELGAVKTKVLNKYIEEHKDMSAEQVKDEIAKAMLGEGIHVDLQKFAFRELVDVLKDDNAKSLVKRFLGELGDKIGADAQATLERMRMGDEEYSEFVTSYVKRSHKADMALAEEHIKSDEKMIDLTLRANIGDKMLSPDEMLALMLKADTVLNAPETYEGEHANWLSTLDSVSSLATKMGQSISIIAKFYQATNRAKNLESTLIDKKQKKRIKDGVKEMEKFLEKERQKAIAEIFKQIESEFNAEAKRLAKEGKVDALSEKTDNTRTDAERFADRVDKIARTPIDEVVESDKPLVNMVSELVSYVVEKNPKLASTLPKGATALEKGAYIFRNRAEYESTLDEGFRMIEDAYLRDPTEYPVNFLDTMHEYLNTTLYPTLKNARMDAIIKQVMKEKNFKLDEIVRDWVRSGEGKFATLSEYIANKSGLSSSESDTLVSEIAFRMAKTRDAKRIAIIEAMLKDKKALTPKTSADLVSEALSLRILHDPKYATINQTKTMAIVNRAMKEMNMSLSEIVVGYEKSGMRLKDYLMSRIKMSESDALVLSNEIDARLREKIADRRAIIVKQLNQMQGDKGRIVKARKSLEDKLSEIVGLDLLNTDALRTIYAEKLNLPVFDDAMTMDVMETVKQINKLDRAVDYEKITELWSDLANRISSKLKITWGDRAMAYRKTMMLSNPATQMRNVTSNLGMNLVRRFEEMFTRNIMGKVFGMQLSSTHEKYTKYHGNFITYLGERTPLKSKLGKMFSTKIWGGTVSYTEGVDADTAKTVSSSWTTDGKPNILNNDKFKVLKAEWIFKTMRGQQKGAKKALQLTEKAMDSLATTVRDSLRHGDLAFAESAYKNAMIGYMKKNGLKAPNADAISYANKAAEEATFRGVNMVSDWIAQGKRKGAVMKWMIDTVIPFAETPTNITKAVWERTGFSGAWELKGWLEQNYNIKHNPNWAQENPKKYKSDDYYAQKFTRSIVGTFGGFGGGIVLQLLGFLTGAKPQDEKERKRWEMNGIIPYALHIPGTNIYVTLDWLQPAAAQLMVGASFSQAMQQDEGFIQAVLSGASGGIDSIMNMTLFTSLKRVLGGQWQDASASLFSIVESYANQFLPAYTNALAKTIDGTVRNTWSPEVGGNIATTFIMRSGLGGFWMMPKVDAWGNDVKQPQATGLGMLERGLNSFLAPWKVSNLNVDNVTKEVTKIYGKAVDGDAKQPGSVLPQIDISNPKVFPYEGDYYTLTEEEYYKYMKYRGQYAHAMIQALMSDSEYNSLPDYAGKGDSKFSWISAVYTDAATKAKEKLGKPKNINK